MTMLGVTVWMPGKYLFLMVPKSEGRVIRFDLELDDKCCFTVGEPRWRETHSVEGVLACQALDAASSWNPLFNGTGMAQPNRTELDEVLHGFFSHPQLFGYEFTAAAVDKVCRLLIMNAQKGLIHLCSKHYYASIVFEQMAGRLNDYVIDVDDIERIAVDFVESDLYLHHDLHAWTEWLASRLFEIRTYQRPLAAPDLSPGLRNERIPTLCLLHKLKVAMRPTSGHTAEFGLNPYGFAERILEDGTNTEVEFVEGKSFH